MIVIDEKFLVIKEINGYLVDIILINYFRSGLWGTGRSLGQLRQLMHKGQVRHWQTDCKKSKTDCKD
jgi:hypothetical protein